MDDICHITVHRFSFWGNLSFHEHLFTHSPADGNLGCFSSGSIVDKSAEDVHVHKRYFLWEHMFSLSSWCTPMNSWSRRMGHFPRNCQFSKVSVHGCTPANVWRLWFTSSAAAYFNFHGSFSRGRFLLDCEPSKIRKHVSFISLSAMITSVSGIVNITHMKVLSWEWLSSF